MKQILRSVVVLLFVVMVACKPTTPTQPTDTPVATPTQWFPPTATPTAEPTEPPTSSPSSIPPSPTASPSEVLDVTPSPPSADTVVLAREDGSLVLHSLSGGAERVLLGPELYDLSGDAFLIAIMQPVRLSPDGAWLLVPTPDDGTWLVSLDEETRRQVTPKRLTATWAPDSRHIVFRGETGPRTREQDREIYVQDVVGEGEPRLLARLPEQVNYPTWSPGCGDIHDSQIAAFSGKSYTSTVWLLDAVSGEQRALGHFSPQPMMDTPSMLRWSPECDAVWVSAHFGPRAFPVDGSGPRPLVSKRRKLSPDGTLRAAVERTRTWTPHDWSSLGSMPTPA